ncbi:MAG: hypothetical protein NTY09_07830 [bacterium]|nr:hypothetical protein [bacterium]
MTLRIWFSWSRLQYTNWKQSWHGANSSNRRTLRCMASVRRGIISIVSCDSGMYASQYPRRKRFADGDSLGIIIPDADGDAGESVPAAPEHPAKAKIVKINNTRWEILSWNE